ncbi:ATPase [Mycolicibacterium komossense]|nr:ATPase [Mycolicibacterium komossense]
MVRDILRAIARVGVAGLVIGAGLVFAPSATALPQTCPPNCDQIPAGAWPAPSSIPLNDDAHWPLLAGVAVSAPAPHFRFEEFCGTPRLPDDPRAYAVAEKAAPARPAGLWQLQAQIMHWRGDTSAGGQSAQSVFNAANVALRLCPVTAPQFTVTFTTDAIDRMAAVLTGPGGLVVHQYVLSHPQSSTVSELVLWNTPVAGVSAQVPWPSVVDAGVFDAMSTPLCEAYLASCG